MSDQPSSNAGIRGAGFYLAWLALPVLSLAVQVLAKVSAGASAGRGAGLSWFFDLCRLDSFRFMVACEAASFLAWIVVLSAMPLSEAFPLSAVSYVFVLVASWTLFDEPVSRMQIAGSCSILVGIWLIARSSEGGRS